MSLERQTVRTDDPPLRFVIRFAWLAVLLVIVGDRLAVGNHRPGWVALAAGAAGWVGWGLARRANRPGWTLVSLVVMGAAGGVLALWSGISVAFLAAAGVAAGSSFELLAAVAIAACGPLTLAVVVFATGGSSWLVVVGTAATLAGLVGGIARREAEQRTAQAALLAVESERAEILSERNRIAREVHDVLAHTLGAVAVQLEAAGAVNDRGGERERLRELLERSRSLVSEGLEETSRAVRALREEPVELERRLAALVASEPVELEVRGEPRQLAPDAGLALYRAAQEAITNVRKHAPGATAHVVLDFRPGETVLTVANSAPTSAPGPATGAGLGLQGMRERLELAGGRLDAGASGSGWTLEAMVPA